MFLVNIHNFRSLAILAIIGAHGLHNFDWTQQETTFHVFDALFNQSSIWFFFIAGFLFQHLSKGYNTRVYFKRKLQNVVLPYLLLSIPAIVASILFVDQPMPEGFDEKHIAIKTVLFLVSGKHLAPFWFVPTITLIFMISPLLIEADRSRWAYLLLVPGLVSSAFLGRDGFLIYSGLSGYFSAVGIAVYLLPAYFFGMFCSRYRLAIEGGMVKLQYPILAIAGLSYYFHLTGFESPVQLPFIFKLTTGVLLVYYLNRFGKPALEKIRYVGDASFGIFFIHGYYLAAIKFTLVALIGKETLPGGVFNYLLFIMMMTAVCCLNLYIIQKVLGSRSRMLVGV